MGFWDFFRRAKTQEPVHTQLGAVDSADFVSLVSKGWRGLPSLTSDILRVDGQRSTMAADAAAHILEQISVDRLSQVDEAIRATFLLGHVGPAVIETWRHQSQSRWAVLCVFSCAPNGHTREAAIHELDTIKNGNELPFLLLRANDWVYEVQRAARKAIFYRIRADYAQHFVRALPLVARLSGHRRVDQTDLVRQVELFLLEQGAEALLDGRRSSEQSVRRACVRLMVRSADDRFGAQLRGSIDDSDPVVAVCAIRYVCSRATDTQLSELVSRVGSFRHPRVRYALLESNATRFASGTAHVFRDALFDRNRSIRELARYQLRDDMEVANGHIYALALPLAKGMRLLATLAGLGDIARPEHTSAVRPFLERNYPPRIRLEALTTYARLTKDLDGVLLAALADPSTGLSKLALRLIVNGRVTMSESDVSALLGSPLPHVRRNALGLLMRQGKWKGLCWALRALESPNFTEADRKVAQNFVVRWEARFNRSFVSPRSEELQEIAALLPRVEAQLTPSATRFLRTVTSDQVS